MPKELKRFPHPVQCFLDRRNMRTCGRWSTSIKTFKSLQGWSVMRPPRSFSSWHLPQGHLGARVAEAPATRCLLVNETIYFGRAHSSVSIFDQNFVFCHLCDIAVVNFNSVLSRSQTLRTSSRSTDPQRSARDCYNFCMADALSQYIGEVRAKVKTLRWDLITEILTSHPADINMEEGSHKVLLVEPEPTNRKVSRTRIVTQTVGQLLWDRDSGENGETITNFSRLYFSYQGPKLHVEDSSSQPSMGCAFKAQHSQSTR